MFADQTGAVSDKSLERSSAEAELESREEGERGREGSAL